MDIQKTKEQIMPIIRKHNISKAALFGSIVTGKMHKNSDIDLLVEVPNSMSLFDFIGIKIELEEKLNKKVDLVEYKGIKPALKNSILAGQLLIYPIHI
ncbi:hypothetical protein COY90_03130 [Candidatus Roizmanbacteria bacterium CG_4_10_14_0_8_um_filter_39_9]|uniref:Polymerase beta nucleotidyltransferase domain-containing protein n=1 Tax=Candidatus Roizmanbacteria bacterium CG_4_10_14_0_8_um_filter_39_9 TaxID=1974829 RepID=A0A2M7QDN0_9BACT|nr:MAG: hypothetical protein COY90_03130 [Candidatus Roizmanbacteria bacterium CG_4_10_14_0_8_um_filter_39_9]